MEKLTDAEMLAMLVQISQNLNNAGFNQAAAKVLMQLAQDLSKPIPREDVVFLNEWCDRLEKAKIKEDPMEVFDLVSDLSQIMKRFVISKENPNCDLELGEQTTGDCENVA